MLLNTLFWFIKSISKELTIAHYVFWIGHYQYYISKIPYDKQYDM